MDSDMWAARISAAKRHHALQQQWDRLNAEDYEGEEEIRPEFSCPFCDEDFDISSLCTHLEDEHLFESKGVICPVCSAKVAKDIVGHITHQHGHLFKIQRRRRFRKAGLPTGSTLSLLGKEYREAHLQTILNSSAFRSRGTSLSNVPDSLLSALALSFPMTDAEDVSKQTHYVDESLPSSPPTPMPAKPSLKQNLEVLSAEEREQKLKQATSRASFVQHLVLSTMMN